MSVGFAEPRCPASIPGVAVGTQYFRFQVLALPTSPPRPPKSAGQRPRYSASSTLGTMMPVERHRARMIVLVLLTVLVTPAPLLAAAPPRSPVNTSTYGLPAGIRRDLRSIVAGRLPGLVPCSRTCVYTPARPRCHAGAQ
ncbi:uncharacterized protein SCHCODRAFT_01315379 [Schizophyllum commune H4-8]|uniref:uncharacterized protein n=1 Tax=Schizophyllum commune (strain H4-8 / FGSC 9210) TaxID=578458 RepID=UPI00215F4ABA|nr:uncharacterized protein SCHCODRAFT_01315379 [Schizophyllum commune H4-8]KAI5890079.1 hypothetical protein SCHCODRAFT_01315379 [Schizophyllum commune H4-8]